VKIRVWMMLFLSVFFLAGCRIQSAEEYFDGSSAPGELLAALEIHCDVLEGKEIPEELAKFLPSDGKLLARKEYLLPEEATAYDLLIAAAKEERILLDVSGEGKAAYIRGIGGLSEFDFGSLSGWMYLVNGERPDVGCGAYRLREGDEVAFCYTCDMGNDLE
jgi:hypothetical protein